MLRTSPISRATARRDDPAQLLDAGARQHRTRPVTVAAVHPGAPCALTGAERRRAPAAARRPAATILYQPFTLAANEPVEVAFSQPPHDRVDHARHRVRQRQRADRGGRRRRDLHPRSSSGTFMHARRSIAFVPDQPWDPWQALPAAARLGHATAAATPGELCGSAATPRASIRSPAPTNGDAGGPGPLDHVHRRGRGHGHVHVRRGRPVHRYQRLGLPRGRPRRRATTTAPRSRSPAPPAIVSSATFTRRDCAPATPETEACMYLPARCPSRWASVTHELRAARWSDADELRAGHAWRRRRCTRPRSRWTPTASLSGSTTDTGTIGDARPRAGGRPGHRLHHRQGWHADAGRQARPLRRRPGRSARAPTRRTRRPAARAPPCRSRSTCGGKSFSITQRRKLRSGPAASSCTGAPTCLPKPSTMTSPSQRRWRDGPTQLARPGSQTLRDLRPSPDRRA